MTKHISFPSIEQYRNVIKCVRDRAAYHKVPVPTLKFRGSVKIHGTNAGVVMDLATGEIWSQSREQLISVDKDNAGFARYVEDHKDTFTAFLNVARIVYGIGKADYLAVYGEWCGQGILKGCAIHQLSKRFIVFGIAAVTPTGTEGDVNNSDDRDWFTPEQVNDVFVGLFGSNEAGDVLTYRDHPDVGIYSVFMLPTFEMTIDFIRPEESQNQLVELTAAVEKECPVGKHWGVSGVGEGIVWKCYETFLIPNNNTEGEVKAVGLIPFRTSDLVFKVKGAKHSESKTTQTSLVDVEKMRSVNEFVEKVVTENRLSMVIEKMKAENIDVSVEKTGEFLKRVGQDVLKEESDTITASGFEKKDVMPTVNRFARNWYMKKLNEMVGLPA